jgi:hypothetical protein
MSAAAKAIWTIQAGIIHAEPIPDFDRRFVLTADEWEEDPTIYTERATEASQYMADISDPSRINWATMEFVWV